LHDDNGLLRQFFPKGMDFSTVGQMNVDIALELLNNQPPEMLKLSEADRGLLKQAYSLRFRLKFGINKKKIFP
jgi:IS30 family transposase